MKRSLASTTLGNLFSLLCSLSVSTPSPSPSLSLYPSVCFSLSNKSRIFGKEGMQRKLIAQKLFDRIDNQTRPKEVEASRRSSLLSKNPLRGYCHANNESRQAATLNYSSNVELNGHRKSFSTFVLIIHWINLSNTPDYSVSPVGRRRSVIPTNVMSWRHPDVLSSPTHPTLLDFRIFTLGMHSDSTNIFLEYQPEERGRKIEEITKRRGVPGLVGFS